MKSAIVITQPTSGTSFSTNYWSKSWLIDETGCCTARSSSPFERSKRRKDHAWGRVPETHPWRPDIGAPRARPRLEQAVLERALPKRSSSTANGPGSAGASTHAANSCGIPLDPPTDAASEEGPPRPRLRHAHLEKGCGTHETVVQHGGVANRLIFLLLSNISSAAFSTLAEATRAPETTIHMSATKATLSAKFQHIHP
ncbi:hypothetical protein PG991_012133 [Apiospora marii]|uniref:Uncharacterized protein n=1 Tax=Apiospora marii TaxID=335849 RepID=A0ABR1R912_9PEZI